MRYAKFYSNETLCRMEAIFDKTCADLEIEDGSEYARSTRESLARLMFELPPPDPAATGVQLIAARCRLIARRRRLPQRFSQR